MAEKAETPRFVVVSLSRAVDSSETLTREFNLALDRLTPPNSELHFLDSISHDGRVLSFFRVLPGTGGRRHSS